MPVFQLFLTWTIQTRAYRFCLNFLHNQCFLLWPGLSQQGPLLSECRSTSVELFRPKSICGFEGKAPPPFAENLHKVEFEWLPYDGLELGFKVL